MSSNRDFQAKCANRDNERGSRTRHQSRRTPDQTSGATPNRPTTYTLDQAAWTLGISVPTLCRAIRRGTIRAERRRNRLVITGAELVRHLPIPLDPPTPGHEDSEEWVDTALRSLNRYRHVPTAVLTELVVQDCAAIWPDEEAPGAFGDADLARQICAGCRSPQACLELELRLAGEDTVGVWGGLCEQDRRVLHTAWAAEREHDDPPTPSTADRDDIESERGWA